MNEIQKYSELLKKTILSDYKGMFKEPGGSCKYKYISPGSNQYATQLWDWDSWTTNIALRQIVAINADEKEKEELFEYEKGCILNFVEYCSWDGWMPIMMDGAGKISLNGFVKPENLYAENMHKPVINQHVAFIISQTGEVEWIREKFYYLQCLCNYYKSHQKHSKTGLYFWINDKAIGVDDDPCTWNRPNKSSASIYLNCLMYKELKACAYIANKLGLLEVESFYLKDAEQLKCAINEHLWDERDGFYYSADLNLLDHVEGDFMHTGYLRDYYCLIQRIDVWSGFMGLWANIADERQAKLIVENKFACEKTFNAPYGIRTLSKMEKMYNVRGSGNPSTWRGPIWGLSNYIVFSGLVNYGFVEQAKEIVEKTILLFGKDIEKTGGLHEYYEPSTGLPILNIGFQNWNYLILNMIMWLEGKEYIKEF